MIDLLARLRKAPLVDPFSGPAILSGRAAGVFFHEIFGHRVEGNRQRNADDGQTFASKVGQPVLPPFLSVVFDPTLKKIGNTELMGHYVYDDEGVKARRVDGGGQGRAEDVPARPRAARAASRRSNGHGRARAGLRARVAAVESRRRIEQDACPTTQLMDMLRDEARQAGQAVRPALRQHRRRLHRTPSRGSPNAFNVLPNVVYRDLHRRRGRPSSCAAST